MTRRTTPQQIVDQLPLTRRAILALSGTAFTGLAGCAGLDNPGKSTQTTTAQSSSVIQKISFDGKNMVVRLQDNHDVTQLNLIAPDGGTFAQTQVAAGATTARLQILSFTGNSYTPGEYKLVAVKGDTQTSTKVELRPNPEIVKVTPQLSESDQQSTGKLLVTVANTGTAPTWVYNIGYKGAPYENAPQVKGSVVDTTFEKPETSDGEIILPGGQQVFLKRRGVLIVDDNDSVTCEGGRAELTVVVQTVHGSVKQEIIAHLSGGYNVEDSGSVQHPCKNVRIERANGGTRDG